MNTETKIKPVAKDSLIYNAIEKAEHATGFLGDNKPRARCIYSVYSIGTEEAQWQVENAWGRILSGSIPVSHIEPYKKENAQ